MSDPAPGASVGERLELIRARVANAAVRSGRAPTSVTLIAVSKTASVDRVREALAAGAGDLGENYVQEALAKMDSLERDEVRWHMIGHLQTNKVRQAVGRFSMIHTVDSLRLAGCISQRAAAAGHIQDVLIELMMGDAPTRTGADPSLVPALADAMIVLPGIRLRGLMGVPPLGADPRPHFAALREALTLLPEGSRSVLSMGMSGDYEAAIAEGATHVRVGTAIFGVRERR